MVALTGEESTVAVLQDCPRCGGDGTVNGFPCGYCAGDELVTAEKADDYPPEGFSLE